MTEDISGSSNVFFDQTECLHFVIAGGMEEVSKYYFFLFKNC